MRARIVGFPPSSLDALARDYYVREQRVAAAIRQHGSFGVIHLFTMVKMDIVVAHGDADQASLARVGRARLDDGADVQVCSAGFPARQAHVVPSWR